MTFLTNPAHAIATSTAPSATLCWIRGPPWPPGCRKPCSPFLTWLTARPAPGEVVPERGAVAFVAGALAWTVGGCALALLPFLLPAAPLAVWLLLPLGWLAASCGLGLFQVVVFHHCSHGTVFATRERNRTVGRLISALLLFKRFDDYQREHMLHHSPRKLLTEEDEFADFVLGMRGLEAGLPEAVLWRRVLLNCVSPRFHLRFALVCHATTGVFPGRTPPAERATTAAGLLRWTSWWAEMLTVHLVVRLFVLVGDAPCHDFHRRRPATRRWTSYIHARQQDVEAGSPGFPAGYFETWGLFRAVDQSLATLAATPPEAIGR